MSNNNENRPVAIQINGVKKMYKLGQIGGGTLQADLQSWWARARGKEDPNTKIGEDQRSNGETFMALNGIDLTIYQGEAVGIIGSNGAGKSTLLKLLSQVTAPTEGDIDIYGRIASMLEVGTGFNGEMTGRENVYMNGAILGMTKAEIDAKMEDIIEFSEVREFIDTPVKRYSSGMYVKLAFSVAAHLDSEIMIMDEVLAVGDMAFQKKCLDKMREAAKQDGRTVLYVSHNMNTIKKLCDRCIVLEKGRIVFDGDTDASISVYMGGLNELSVDRSFEEIRRDRYNIDNLVRINRIAILNKEFPVFFENEPLNLKIYFDTQCECVDLFFRISYQSVNYDVIGMSATEKGLNLAEGEHSIELSLNCDCLATGKYILKVVAYSMNEFGKQFVHDVIDNAISFEKKRVNEKNFTWNSNWWGYIDFPSISIINIYGG